ncbi:MAG: EthD family reductase [Chloroflexi bacterium]|nr:EthD family reductase [Chloroflexota bacterium]
MIKYVALWKLGEGVSPEEFEAEYRTHVEAAAKRMPGLRKYQIGRVLSARGFDDSYYRIAELYFDDVESLKSAMNYLTSLSASDPANPSGARDLMASTLALICDEETIGLPNQTD